MKETRGRKRREERKGEGTGEREEKEDESPGEWMARKKSLFRKGFVICTQKCS